MADVYLKKRTDDSYCWCTRIKDPETEKLVETMVWEEIIAWSYYPDPYIV